MKHLKQTIARLRESLEQGEWCIVEKTIFRESIRVITELERRLEVAREALTHYLKLDDESMRLLAGFAHNKNNIIIDGESVARKALATLNGE